MSSSIEKNFHKKLTKKDYLLYLLNRNALILVSPLVIISLIVLFVYMVKKNGFQSTDLVYLLPILLFVLSYIQIYNSINKALKSNKDSGDILVTLTSNEYKEKTSNGEVALAYNKFYSYYEAKDYYYLYVDRINALILPKREFSNEELALINTYFINSKIKKEKLFNTKNIFSLFFSIALIVCVILLIIAM